MKQEILKGLKDKLQEELKKEDPDSSVILELSSELSKKDTGNVRFSVDAAIIDKLGKELVGKQETAVAELVKNSYDADALSCDLIFESTNDVGGTLIIEDDGNGMDREELINGFMRISSSDKLHNPVSPRYNRQRAGRKGIGRFATQRLGSQLTIITQKKESKSAFKITIDWDQYSLDKELSHIVNSIEEISKITSKTSFTKLIVNNLRESFTTTSLKRIFRYVSDLQQPFQLVEKGNDGKDPGFVSRIFRSIDNDLEIIADEDTLYYDNALAIIEGTVTKEGIGKVSLKSKLLDYEDYVEIDYEPVVVEDEDEEYRLLKINEEQVKKDSFNPYSYLNHNLKFKIFYYIFKSEFVPKNDFGKC